VLIAVAAGLVAGAALAVFMPARDAPPPPHATAQRPAAFGLVPRETPRFYRGATIPPSRERIVGRASVIDADTIEIRGQSIRLFGIDALEDDQKCLRGGKRQRCAQRAANALAHKIGRGNVACDKIDRDRYGRLVAICFAGSENLNAWLVAQGWALAYRRYSLRYVEHEDRAHAAQRGIWATRFVKPWDARRGVRLNQRVAQRQCAL